MVSKGSRVTGFDIGVESLYKTRGNSHVSCYQSLERKASDDEACGEVEMALGSQDTFYV